MRLFQYFRSKLQEFSNFPKEYIQRSKQQIYYETPRGRVNYLPKTVEKKRYRYTMNRSWTGQFKQQNMIMRKKVFVMPTGEWGYFRGDRVEVLVGKDKGKHGLVVQVIPERNWVVVEGVNCHYRTIGKEKEFPGVVIKSEAPLDVTKDIRLVDPSDLLGCEWEWRYTEEGEKVRVSIRTGRLIPIPEANNHTHDYRSKKAYLERSKDTPGAVVSKVTFTPKLCTFEMDIMDEMNIKEDRVPKPSYWY